MDPNLPSLHHIRDLGKSINALSNSPILKENNIFISATTKEASQAENDHLRNILGIRTVVDTAWESDRLVNSQLPPSTIEKPLRPLSWLSISDVLGVRYCGLKFRRGPYMDELMGEMGWWAKMYVLSVHNANGH